MQPRSMDVREEVEQKVPLLTTRIFCVLKQLHFLGQFWKCLFKSSLFHSSMKIQSPKTICISSLKQAARKVSSQDVMLKKKKYKQQKVLIWDLQLDKSKITACGWEGSLLCKKRRRMMNGSYVFIQRGGERHGTVRKRSLRGKYRDNSFAPSITNIHY